MDIEEQNQLFSLLSPVNHDMSESIGLIHDIFAFIVTDSNSGSESDEAEEESHHNCVDFVKTIDAFDEDGFKSHMRISRQTMEYLIEIYSRTLGPIESNFGGGREKIDSRATIYMYVWYISNTVTFRQLGNLFGVSKSIAWFSVKRVTAYLIKIGHEYVKWPQGNEAEETQAEFQRKEGMPSVIGAIDCTHIIIEAPKLSMECYYNSKQSYSIILQAVVDAKNKFIDITCGEPGSLDDSRVLRRSDLTIRAQTNFSDMFPNETFLLGDSAYPSTSWLVPPFKDYGNLTESQHNFNKIHSATRIVVENTFGLLKGRFRRLRKFTEQTNICAITNLIASACVLHNICLLCDDSFVFSFTETINSTASEGNTTGEVVNAAGDRREALFNYLLQEELI